VEQKREVARRDVGNCGNVSFRQNQQMFARAWVLRRKSNCLTVASGVCTCVGRFFVFGRVVSAVGQHQY
jgi:hypothetical protein